MAAKMLDQPKHGLRLQLLATAVRLNTVRATLLLILLPWLARAQQSPTIRTEVPLVMAPVTVTDAKGHYIDGLSAGDFVLMDNQSPRPFQLDTSDTTLIPISIVLVVQINNYAGAVVAKLHKVGSMIQPLITGVRGDAAVVAFDERVWTVQDFTSDPSQIEHALEEIQPSADTQAHIVDAISDAVHRLAQLPTSRRKVILLISEAKDRGSKGKPADVLQAAQRENITIYSASYSAYTTAFTAKAEDLPPPEGGNLLTIFTELGRLGKSSAAEAFARYTGGRHLSFTRQSGLEKTIAGVGEELHSQYLLSFTPAKSGETGYHSIDVKLPGRSDAKVRTRPGYWAVEP
jgi:VWFA-related protein